MVKATLLALFGCVLMSMEANPLANIEHADLSQNVEWKKLCLLLAIPGRSNNLDISLFKTNFGGQLDKIGRNIFGNVSHTERMHQTSKCTRIDISTLKCAYRRLYMIYKYLQEDLKQLQNEIGSNTNDAEQMYIALLSTWYLDRVFLGINCGPVDVKTTVPVVQFKYIAQWSHHLNSRDKFCTMSKVFGKTAAKNLREDVASLCLLRDEPVCKLIPFFDVVDNMENLCGLVSSKDWTDISNDFVFLKKAAYLSFYSLKLKTPHNIANRFHSNSHENGIKQKVIDILFQLYDDFRKSDLNLVSKLVKVLPDLPCDFTAQFPSYGWMMCAGSKTFTEIKIYIEANEIGKSKSGKKHKMVVSDIDYAKLIRERKVTQLKELSEQHGVSLQSAVTTIKNDIQERFKQLGKYFTKVAKYEKEKSIADVDYIKGRINLYQDRYQKYTNELSSNIVKLLGIFTRTALKDSIVAVGKLTIQMAKASNPLKWVFGSGNADKILEATESIAMSGLKLIRQKEQQ